MLAKRLVNNASRQGSRAFAQLVNWETSQPAKEQGNIAPSKLSTPQFSFTLQDNLMYAKLTQSTIIPTILTLKTWTTSRMCASVLETSCLTTLIVLTSLRRCTNKWS